MMKCKVLTSGIGPGGKSDTHSLEIINISGIYNSKDLKQKQLYLAWHRHEIARIAVLGQFNFSYNRFIPTTLGRKKQVIIMSHCIPCAL